MPIAKRALIADDHSLYRHGLALLLRDQFSYSVVTEASSFDEAVAGLDLNPGAELALFDLAMPGMAGPRSLVPLRSRYPKTKIVIVSASETKADVLDAIGAGLGGFIPKSLPTKEVIAAIKTILGGRIYVPELMMAQELEIVRALRPWQVARDAASSGETKYPAVLTARQKEVLACVRAGMLNREIAVKLGISTGTVKIHVTALLSALRVRNRVQLVSEDEI